MINDKLKRIYKIKNFDYLLKEKQDKNKISKYYNINKLAYRIFHNYKAFLHMGISNDDFYKKSDLLNQAKYISKYIKENKAKKIMELGYGRGANLFYLSQLFPNKKFFGIDLSTKPIKKYKGKNIEYIQDDIHNLESYRDTFDLIYAVETICHSNNLNKLFSGINSTLNSQDCFIVFDGYYLINKSMLNKDFKLACTLTEKGMAVDKFHNLDAFKNIAEDNGFILRKEINFSKNIKPSLYKLQKISRFYIKIPILAKIINLFLPKIVLHNFLSAYLMPDLVENNIAGYYMHIFQKK